MAETPEEENKSLEDALARATEGDRESVKEFFHSFLSGPLFVPSRHQKAWPGGQASYPNDLIDVLAVPREDTQIVPVFSSVGLIEQWCARELSWRELSGTALLQMIPDEWHLCVNPACDFEKEITPWEVQRLKMGDQGIEEICAEILADEQIKTLELQATEKGQHRELKELLKKEAARFTSIRNLYLVVELGETAGGERPSTLLLGVSCDNIAVEKLEHIQNHFQNVLDRSLIGDLPARAVAGCFQGQSIILSAFRGFEPFYRRSVLMRLWAGWGGLLGVL